jgi:hypothetical protein
MLRGNMKEYEANHSTPTKLKLRICSSYFILLYFIFLLYQTRIVRGDQGGAARWVVNIFSTPCVQSAVCGLELSFSNASGR